MKFDHFIQVTPHRLCVVLLVREYCQYKAALPTIAPGERTSLCLLVLGLVQEPDLDLSSMCAKVEAAVPGGLSTAWAQGIARLQSEGVAGREVLKRGRACTNNG